MPCQAYYASQACNMLPAAVRHEHMRVNQVLHVHCNIAITQDRHEAWVSLTHFPHALDEQHLMPT